MGWGDAAKAAFAKAVEALQAIAELKAIVHQVMASAERHEQRVQSRLDAIETRIRELERENAKLHGQVQAAYGDALKTVFFDRSIVRRHELPKAAVERNHHEDTVQDREDPTDSAG